MRKPAKSTRTVAAERLAELKQNARGILAECRRELMNRQPFIGSVAMNLGIVPVRDRRCPTACTDGKDIYFDICFLSSLNIDQRLFVLAHEIWHNVMLHFVRVEGRDRKLFNIATDLEVNQLLKLDGLIPPKGCCMPDAYNVPPNLSAEEYYELLLKRNSGSGSSSNASSGGSESSGNADGELSGQFDKHVFEGDEVSKETGLEKTEDKYGVVGQDTDFTPNTVESAVEHMREAAIAAATALEQQRGTLPAHIASLVNKLLEPEVKWQEVLQQFVTRCFGDRREWNPPNRRHVWHGSYLQSRRGEKLKIAVGIDTSGSVTALLPKFLGELNGLVQSFGNYELHLIQCDTDVNDYHLYSDDDPLDLENEAFEAKGMGGTKLHPIFDYINDNGLEIDACVVFTDGYCEEFDEDDAPAFPVLWMVTKDGDTSKFHFGEITKFNE